MARVYRILERVAGPDGLYKISAVMQEYPGARVVLHGQSTDLKLGDQVTLEREPPRFVRYAPATQEASS